MAERAEAGIEVCNVTKGALYQRGMAGRCIFNVLKIKPEVAVLDGLKDLFTRETAYGPIAPQIAAIRLLSGGVDRHQVTGVGLDQFGEGVIFKQAAFGKTVLEPQRGEREFLSIFLADVDDRRLCVR